jgi:hypothetical protein
MAMVIMVEETTMAVIWWELWDDVGGGNSNVRDCDIIDDVVTKGIVIMM